MNKKLETAEMDELLRAILSLETVEEAYEFFEDLCTVNEMVALRWLRCFVRSAHIRTSQTRLVLVQLLSVVLIAH